MTAGRPRPYASHPRPRADVPPPVKLHGSEASLRPLTASLVATGIMTIGVLQFLGEMWGELPPEGRHGITLATRVASLMFLSMLAMAALAWVARESAPRSWLVAANALSVIAFGGGAFLVTREISRALSAAERSVSALPPGDIGAFIGATVLAPLLLMSWLLAGVMWRFLSHWRKHVRDR
jgi:hypothetical protein